MGSGSSSRPDAGWVVGSGVSGADGLLGRCLTYSLQLDWYSADTQSEWADMIVFQWFPARYVHTCGSGSNPLQCGSGSNLA